MNHSVLVDEQYKAKTGRIDLSLYAEIGSEKKKTVPIVIFEMSLNNNFSEKKCQLFNTANSCIIYQMEENPWPLLGVIFNGDFFEIHIYFASNCKVVDLTILENQEADAKNWQCLFDMIRYWSINIATSIENGRVYTYMADSRVCHDEKQEYVYKTYDYRHNNDAVRRIRSPSFYFNDRIMKSCEYVLKTDLLQIIKYPYLEGDLQAKSSFEFRAVLKQLRSFRQLNLVHGDIRLANILFNHVCPKKSTLIDFDYSAHVGTKFPRHIAEVPDGYRSEAMLNEGVMTLKEDMICMAACMKFFTANDKYEPIWNACVEHVQKGHLNKAIKLIKKAGNFELSTHFFDIRRAELAPPRPSMSKRSRMRIRIVSLLIQSAKETKRLPQKIKRRRWNKSNNSNCYFPL